MNVRVLKETEVPNADPIKQVTEERSEKSLPVSPSSVDIQKEIRRILNARASAIMAMIGSFILTAAAMVQGTPMSLGIAISYDLLVFLPIAVIAYRTTKG